MHTLRVPTLDPVNAAKIGHRLVVIASAEIPDDGGDVGFVRRSDGAEADSYWEVEASTPLPDGRHRITLEKTWNGPDDDEEDDGEDGDED